MLPLPESYTFDPEEEVEELHTMQLQRMEGE